MYIAIVLFVNAFIYLFQDKMVYETLFSEHIVQFILFCLVSIIIANIYFYIKSLLYFIPKSQVRKLLFPSKTSKKKFDSDYITILKRNRCGVIIETIVFIIFLFVSFVFSFGLCAVYPEQGKCMFVSILFGVIADFIFSILTELFIILLYMCKGNQILVIILDYVNRAKSYKVLSP